MQNGFVRARAVAGFLRLKAAHALSEVLQATLFFGGLAAIAFGGWMIYKPLGPIFGGLFAVWISFLREN